MDLLFTVDNYLQYNDMPSKVVTTCIIHIMMLFNTDMNNVRC